MTTNEAMNETTRAMIASTQRMLDEARAIKSPRDLGIIPDTSRNARRPARIARRRRFIR